MEIPHKNKSVPLLHILACSLNKNFDDLQHLLSCTKTKFDIITINETRIAKEVCLSNNLNLNNYSFKFIPTESCAGVTLLYIVNHLSYKCRSDLNIYQKWTLVYFYWNCQSKIFKYYCKSHSQTSMNKILSDIKKFTVIFQSILWPWSHNSYKWVSTKLWCYYLQICYVEN